MALFAEAVRPLWMYLINEVNFLPQRGISWWVREKDYHFFSFPISCSDSFTVDTVHSKYLQDVFAFEANKMAAAAIESISGIDFEKHSNKAAAWPIIRLYYSAYYSAHALLRIFGHCCSHLDRIDSTALHSVAALFHPASLCPQTVYYSLIYNNTINQLIFSKDNSGKGSHYFLWQSFKTIIDLIIAHLSSSNSSTRFQSVLLQLINLRNNLCLAGNNSGTWLTSIRNSVTYRHEWNVWHPYKNQPKRFSEYLLNQMFATIDASSLIVKSDPNDLLTFVQTCSFIISACWETIEDISDLCPNGKSIFCYGVCSLIRSSKLLPSTRIRYSLAPKKRA